MGNWKVTKEMFWFEKAKKSGHKDRAWKVGVVWTDSETGNEFIHQPLVPKEGSTTFSLFDVKSQRKEERVTKKEV